MWALVAITLAAAFLRFYQLHTFPVGFHIDEASDFLDASHVGLDFHPIYFTADNGREPFYYYWCALFINGLQDVPFASRLASAFLGIATIPATYFCFSQMLRQAEGRTMARRIGLFAAAVTAFLFIHLNFSRIATRTISLPLFECIAFGLLWMAARKQSTRLYVVAGVMLGACLYTYTASRLLVLTFAVYGIYLAVTQRRTRLLKQPISAFVAFILTSLPLGLYALTNSSSFFQRTGTIAVLDRQAILNNALNVARMFFIKGSINGGHNIVGLPFFDPAIAAVFIIGLPLLVVRLRHPAYVFTVVWLATIALASVFSPDAPYYVRLTGLIPPAALIPALTLAKLPDWLARLNMPPVKASSRVLTFMPSVALVVISGGTVFHNYFDVWGPSNDTYFWMMQDKVDAVSSLRQEAQNGAHIFLAPLYHEDLTFRALTSSLPIQSFNAKDCTVLPSRGTDVVYAFPPYDITQPAALLAHLPPSAREEPVLNPLQQPVLIDVRVPAQDLPSGPTNLIGNFGNQIGLADVAGLPKQPVAPGSSIRLTLVWQTIQQPKNLYTVFIHADDAVHHARVQRDALPCGGSFPSYSWRPGDQITDPYELVIPKEALPGTYQITTGLYSLPGPTNLTLAGTQTAELNIGSFQVS